MDADDDPDVIASRRLMKQLKALDDAKKKADKAWEPERKALKKEAARKDKSDALQVQISNISALLDDDDDMFETPHATPKELPRVESSFDLDIMDDSDTVVPLLDYDVMLASGIYRQAFLVSPAPLVQFYDILSVMICRKEQYLVYAALSAIQAAMVAAYKNYKIIDADESDPLVSHVRNGGNCFDLLSQVENDEFADLKEANVLKYAMSWSDILGILRDSFGYLAANPRKPVSVPESQMLDIGSPSQHIMRARKISTHLPINFTALLAYWNLCLHLCPGRYSLLDRQSMCRVICDIILDVRVGDEQQSRLESILASILGWSRWQRQNDAWREEASDIVMMFMQTPQVYRLALLYHLPVNGGRARSLREWVAGYYVIDACSDMISRPDDRNNVVNRVRPDVPFDCLDVVAEMLDTVRDHVASNLKDLSFVMTCVELILAGHDSSSAVCLTSVNDHNQDVQRVLAAVSRIRPILRGMYLIEGESHLEDKSSDRDTTNIVNIILRMEAMMSKNEIVAIITDLT